MQMCQYLAFLLTTNSGYLWPHVTLSLLEIKHVLVKTHRWYADWLCIGNLSEYLYIKLYTDNLEDLFPMS